LCTRGVYFRYDGLPADIGSGSMTWSELFRDKIYVATSPRDRSSSSVEPVRPLSPTPSDGAQASTTSTTPPDAVRVGRSKLLYLRHAGITPATLCLLLENLREYVMLKQQALKINKAVDDALGASMCRLFCHRCCLTSN
jgi:hypothetical protein